MKKWSLWCEVGDSIVCSILMGLFIGLVYLATIAFH